MTIHHSFRPSKAQLAELAEWHRKERAQRLGLPLDMSAVEIDQHVTEMNRQKNIRTYGLPADADWDAIAKAARATFHGRVHQPKITPES